MSRKIFSAIFVLALPFQLVLAGKSYGFDLDEATRMIQAEQHKQQLRKQYHQKYQQRQKQKRARGAAHLRQQQQQNAAPVARHLAPAHQQADFAVPEADDLFAAANNGDVGGIARLLSQGVNVNSMNRERETALHMAAARGQYRAVIYLVNHGAYVNARTVKNWIPLHHAVRFRHPNIANYLLKRGSSPYDRTSDGMSAIDMARSVNDQRMLGLLGER